MIKVTERTDCENVAHFSRFDIFILCWKNIFWFSVHAATFPESVSSKALKINQECSSRSVLKKIEYFKILVGFYASMFSKNYLEQFNRMSNVFCSLLVCELLWELIWISYPVTSVTRQGPTRFVASSIMMKISALNHFIFQRNLYWLWDQYAHLCSFTFTSYENMQI